MSDTGIGMSPEVRTRVFDPSSPPKERGKGTGLGLSTVFGIAKLSGGSIWLSSEPGAGTTFRIYLPRAEGRAEAPRPTTSIASVRGTETILLVEDDEQVRIVAGNALRKAGYAVLVTGGSGEGLRVAREHPATIDLLLTDIVMPGMTGRAAPRHPRALHVGVHGRRDPAPRRVRIRGGVPPEAADSVRVDAQGARGPRRR
ncbi:MAG: ATP-binding protein [Candidatus Eiseniibacteriota bacterium]